MTAETDIFQKLATQALEAGVGEVTSFLLDPLLQLIMPQPSSIPTFSSIQIQQIKDALGSEIAKYEDLRNEAQFDSINDSIREYMSSKKADQLSILEQKTIELSHFFLVDTEDQKKYIHAKTYLAAACQHLTCLKLDYQANKDSEKARCGILDNICEWLKEILEKLADFEQKLLEDQGFELFSAFMQYLLYSAEQPPETIPWFGAEYRKNVIALLIYSKFLMKDGFKDIKGPKYVLKFFSKKNLEPIWGFANTDHHITFFTCPLLEGYYPIGDVGETSITAYSDGSFAWDQPITTRPFAEPVMFTWQDYFDQVCHIEVRECPYIKMYDPDSKLIHPDRFEEVYNDHGSRLKRNYSAWNFSNSCNSDFIQISTVNGQGYNQPDSNRLCLFDKADTDQKTVGACCWDDKDSGAQEDCTVYPHPQFGKWGLYNLFRSHSHYTGTVPVFKLECFVGHPIFDENIVDSSKAVSWLNSYSAGTV